MAEERRLDNRLNDLENALQDLAPAPARLNTSETIYLAGQQSVMQRRRWQKVWPACTACLAVLCLSLGLTLIRQDNAPQLAQQDKPDAVASPDDQADDQPEPLPGASDQSPKARRPAPATPAPAASWPELASRLQIQEQLLADLSDVPATDSAPDNPVVIESVSSADWPEMLTDESVGERFRLLAEPIRRPPVAFEYLSNFFPKRG